VNSHVIAWRRQLEETRLRQVHTVGHDPLCMRCAAAHHAVVMDHNHSNTITHRDDRDDDEITQISDIENPVGQLFAHFSHRAEKPNVMDDCIPESGESERVESSESELSEAMSHGDDSDIDIDNDLDNDLCNDAPNSDGVLGADATINSGLPGDPSQIALTNGPLDLKMRNSLFIFGADRGEPFSAPNTGTVLARSPPAQNSF
jgi:hypothetical protein